MKNNKDDQINKLFSFIVRLVLALLIIVTGLSYLYRRVGLLIIPNSTIDVLLQTNWSLIWHMTLLYYIPSVSFSLLISMVVLDIDYKFTNMFRFACFLFILIFLVFSLFIMTYEQFQIFISVFTIFSVIISVFRFSIR